MVTFTSAGAREGQREGACHSPQRGAQARGTPLFWRTPFFWPPPGSAKHLRRQRSTLAPMPSVRARRPPRATRGGAARARGTCRLWQLPGAAAGRAAAVSPRGCPCPLPPQQGAAPERRSGARAASARPQIAPVRRHLPEERSPAAAGEGPAAPGAAPAPRPEPTPAGSHFARVCNFIAASGRSLTPGLPPASGMATRCRHGDSRPASACEGLPDRPAGALARRRPLGA